MAQRGKWVKLEPVYDWDPGDLIGPLAEGQKIPRGWVVWRITKEDTRGADTWVCRCGCGRTYRVGERYAVKKRGIRVTGFASRFRW